MNRQDRRTYLSSLKPIVTKIQSAPTWEDRWFAVWDFFLGIAHLAQKRGHDDQDVSEAIGGELASRVIEALGSLPITEVLQSLVYLLSSEPAHQNAAETWQLQHPNEMRELQRRYPDIPMQEVTRGRLH